MAPKAVTIQCHAKVNLFLHVTGKRGDGYHDLQSWVAFANLGDELSLRPAGQYHLVADGPFAPMLPSMADNLITKTVQLIAARHGKKPNFFLELTKNLPIGSGLGGGSANAAAAARALQQFWGFDWGPEDTVWLAKSLGADVPVCLAGRSCIISGIGEILELAAPPPADVHLVFVYPNVMVMTKRIFETLAPPYTPPLAEGHRASPAVVELVRLLQNTRNDLMHPAMGLEPKVLQAYRALGRQPGCMLARMTGSGSTCFGIFPDAVSARQAVQAIRRQEPEWWVRQAQFLPA